MIGHLNSLSDDIDEINKNLAREIELTNEIEFIQKILVFSDVLRNNIDHLTISLTKRKAIFNEATESVLSTNLLDVTTLKSLLSEISSVLPNNAKLAFDKDFVFNCINQNFSCTA